MSSAYRARKGAADSTGWHVRRCLWHQYGPSCGSRGKSRSKWAARRADRAARVSTTRSDVAVLVLADQGAEGEQLADSRGRVPRREVVRGSIRLRGLERSRALGDLAQLALEQERVVAPCLHVHQQAVERGDVHPRRVAAALERLRERGSRARERIEHVAARPHVAGEQRLDELRHELAEVGMEPVDVARPLPLRELALRPGELEVQAAVERLLRRGHRLTLSRRSSGLLPRLDQGVADPLEPAVRDGDDLERDIQAGEVRMRRQPRLRSPAEAPLLLGADHRRRSTRSRAPDLALTSQKTSLRPRRTTRSSSYPADQAFSARMR